MARTTGAPVENVITKYYDLLKRGLQCLEDLDICVMNDNVVYNVSCEQDLINRVCQGKNS